MTIGDLLLGAWTWGELGNEALPVVLVAASSFFAGYAKGWNVGTRDTERRWSDAVGRADDRRKA